MNTFIQNTIPEITKNASINDDIKNLLHLKFTSQKLQWAQKVLPGTHQLHKLNQYPF